MLCSETSFADWPHCRADRGLQDPRAAMLLGQMYDRGLGTTVDKREAYAWSEVSVLERDAAAKRQRDLALEALGPGDKKAAITLAETILTNVRRATGSKTAEG